MASVNLCISGFFLCNILMHMIRPGANTGYTRMLMLLCIATIPVSFMMVFIGGRDRWPALISQAREMAGNSPQSTLILAALAILLIIMPLGILLAIWFGMGLRLGLYFIIFFVPLFLRLRNSPMRASVETAVIQIVLYFVSFFIGIGIVFLVGVSESEPYERHLQVIWPGYRDAAKMFFSVCVFAFLNQLIEFSRAFTVLFKK